MGYTHYLYTPLNIDSESWEKICEDAKVLFDYSQNVLGIELGDGQGENTPVINKKFISFNGSVKQTVGKWTTTEDIFLAWPSDDISIDEPKDDPIQNPKSGVWFAGDILNHRSCTIIEGKNYADGSYETCAIYKKEDPKYAENGLVFTCCKVSSVGNEKDYLDSRMLLFNLFGYGMDENVN